MKNELKRIWRPYAVAAVLVIPAMMWLEPYAAQFRVWFWYGG